MPKKLRKGSVTLYREDVIPGITRRTERKVTLVYRPTNDPKEKRIRFNALRSFDGTQVWVTVDQLQDDGSMMTVADLTLDV